MCGAGEIMSLSIIEFNCFFSTLSGASTLTGCVVFVYLLKKCLEDFLIYFISALSGAGTLTG